MPFLAILTLCIGAGASLRLGLGGLVVLCLASTIVVGAGALMSGATLAGASWTVLEAVLALQVGYACGLFLQVLTRSRARVAEPPPPILDDSSTP